MNTHQFTAKGTIAVNSDFEPVTDYDGNIVGFTRLDGSVVKLVVSLELMSADEGDLSYHTSETDMENLGFSDLDYLELHFGEKELTD